MTYSTSAPSHCHQKISKAVFAFCGYGCTGHPLIVTSWISKDKFPPVLRVIFRMKMTNSMLCLWLVATTYKYQRTLWLWPIEYQKLHALLHGQYQSVWVHQTIVTSRISKAIFALVIRVISWLWLVAATYKYQRTLWLWPEEYQKSHALLHGQYQSVHSPPIVPVKYQKLYLLLCSVLYFGGK